MKLNQNQHQAIEHLRGPLLIIAGAGTGKTTVITERIKYLIQEKKVDPYHIFAATFTEKAAEEMRARLDVVMPFGYLEPWLGTFHGLCERLLQTEGLEMGLNPNFKILTQTDQWMFLREHLYEFNFNYYRPLGNPTRFVSALIKFFSRLSDEDIDPILFDSLVVSRTKHAATVEEQSDAARLSELSSAYSQYQQLKREHNFVDFGDLIVLSLKLLRDRPNVKAKYQKQFEYLLVDEFQDTNFAQFELIKLLAPPSEKPNLTVVGDDDQSIYKFRGASVSNILEFKEIYPDAKEIILSENYRSTQFILDAAYQSIIKNNPDRLEAKLGLNKKLTAQIKSDVKPEVLHFSSIEDEVSWTVTQIIELVTQNNLNYKDIAIIARANSQLELYVNALRASGLPYQLVANHGLFDQEEIKTLLTFVKVLADPTDTLSLFQLSQASVFDLDPQLVLTHIKNAKVKSGSLWEELKQETDKKTVRLVTTITEFQQHAGAKTISQILYQFIGELDYLKPLIETESIENQLKIKNLNLFFNRLKQFEMSSTNKSIVGFLESLELWLEAGENPGQSQIEDIDTINIMTVHAAKGLEFDAVFVASLVAGRFPSNSKKDPIGVPSELIKEVLPEGDEHIQEERRLFYVAVTRAKRFLYLTYSENVGGVRKRKMSGFIEETQLPITNHEVNVKSVPRRLTISSPHPRYLSAGKYVIDTVSYSQIDTFDACPLKYKYRYLLQIPAKPHHSLSFGRTIHQTLYQLHAQEMQGKPGELDALLNTYSQNFIEEGYEDATHKAQRFEAGKAAMVDYFNHYHELFGRPILLEQAFQLKLKAATLVGKIDRIDEIGNGKYEIIDYKTGTHKDQKHADKDEQLTIYALASREVLHIPIAQMSLYFIEKTEDGKAGEKITTTRTDAQLSEAQAKLESRIEAMQNSDFPAKPDPVKCGFCEYQSLCPFASKKAK